MGEVLEMHVGDGCATVSAYLMPLSYTLRMVKVVSFVACILSE